MLGLLLSDNRTGTRSGYATGSSWRRDSDFSSSLLKSSCQAAAREGGNKRTASTSKTLHDSSGLVKKAAHGWELFGNLIPDNPQISWQYSSKVRS